MIDHEVILFQINETVMVQLPNMTTVKIVVDDFGLPVITTHDNWAQDNPVSWVIEGGSNE